ncbi:Uncharacterised protein [Shigella sonnei]|nr:Uncharacterised protein [Shigella sonnei]
MFSRAVRETRLTRPGSDRAMFFWKPDRRREVVLLSTRNVTATVCVSTIPHRSGEGLRPAAVLCPVRASGLCLLSVRHNAEAWRVSVTPCGPASDTPSALHPWSARHQSRQNHRRVFRRCC